MQISPKGSFLLVRPQGLSPGSDKDQNHWSDTRRKAGGGWHHTTTLTFRVSGAHQRTGRHRVGICSAPFSQERAFCGEEQDTLMSYKRMDGQQSQKGWNIPLCITMTKVVSDLVDWRRAPTLSTAQPRLGTLPDAGVTLAQSWSSPLCLGLCKKIQPKTLRLHSALRKGSTQWPAPPWFRRQEPGSPLVTPAARSPQSFWCALQRNIM